jgi:hypothetical protein
MSDGPSEAMQNALLERMLMRRYVRLAMLCTFNTW